MNELKIEKSSWDVLIPYLDTWSFFNVVLLNKSAYQSTKRYLKIFKNRRKEYFNVVKRYPVYIWSIPSPPQWLWKRAIHLHPWVILHGGNVYNMHLKIRGSLLTEAQVKEVPKEIVNLAMQKQPSLIIPLQHKYPDLFEKYVGSLTGSSLRSSVFSINPFWTEKLLLQWDYYLIMRDTPRIEIIDSLHPSEQRNFVTQNKDYSFFPCVKLPIVDIRKAFLSKRGELPMEIHVKIDCLFWALEHHMEEVVEWDDPLKILNSFQLREIAKKYSSHWNELIKDQTLETMTIRYELSEYFEPMTSSELRKIIYNFDENVTEYCIQKWGNLIDWELFSNSDLTYMLIRAGRFDILENCITCSPCNNRCCMCKFYPHFLDKILDTDPTKFGIFFNKCKDSCVDYTKIVTKAIELHHDNIKVVGSNIKFKLPDKLQIELLKKDPELFPKLCPWSDEVIEWMIKTNFDTISKHINLLPSDTRIKALKANPMLVRETWSFNTPSVLFRESWNKIIDLHPHLALSSTYSVQIEHRNLIRQFLLSNPWLVQKSTDKELLDEIAEDLVRKEPRIVILLKSRVTSEVFEACKEIALNLDPTLDDFFNAMN